LVLNIGLDSIMEVNIDGMDGYEMVGHGVDFETHNPALIHKVVLYGEDGFYYVSSRATGREEINLPLFKRLSGTFKRRRM
jgi:hypothetical protein